MSSAELVSVSERATVLLGLEKGHRADGRGVSEARVVQLTLTTVHGITRAELQLGRTRVLAVVSAEVVSPFSDRPNEGFLQFQTEISPMASPFFEAGRPGPLAAQIGSIVEQGIRESNALDVEALCIVAGAKVWQVRCDISVLDHCGNMVDAAVFAAIAALLHFRRPEVTVVGDEVTIHPIDEREPERLPIHHVPLCFTFGLVEQHREEEEEVAILDPTDREELVVDGTLTVSLNKHGEVCGVYKHGLPPVSPEHLLRCVHLAARQRDLWEAVLNTALEAANATARG